MQEINNGDDLYAAASVITVDLAAPLTSVERAVIGWQFGRHGGFFTSLWKAITQADSGNLVRLYKAFPDHILGYAAYIHNPGWWDAVVRKMGKEG